MPIHGWRFGLTRQRDHFAHGIGIAGNIDDSCLNALARKVMDHFVTPWATRLDVENRKVHEESFNFYVFSFKWEEAKDLHRSRL